MSDHEWIPYETPFASAADKFGWVLGEYAEYHERDESRSWINKVWLDGGGNRVMDKYDMEEGLVRELIRIAGLLPEAAK